MQGVLQPGTGFAQGIREIQELLKAAVGSDHHQLAVEHRKPDVELIQPLRKQCQSVAQLQVNYHARSKAISM